MHRLLPAAVAAVLLTATPAFGHGDENQVMGTLRAVEPGQVVVETPDGHSVSLRVTSETVYRNVSGAETKERPQVGSRVVVDLKDGRDGDRTADSIRFRSSPSTKPEPTGHGDRR